MLERFFSKKSDAVHPLFTESGIQALVKGMPRDDVGFLVAIDGWLDSIPALVADFGLEPCLRAAYKLDHASRLTVSNLLRDYLDQEGGRYLSLLVHDKLSAHVNCLCDAYFLVVQQGGESPAGKKKTQNDKQVSPQILNVIGTEFFRLWGLGRRLSNFRYLEQGVDSWGRAHSMLSHLKNASVIISDKGAFGGESGGPFREYLNVIYLSLAPLTNLTPQQLEFTFRLIAEAESLVCQETPDGNPTHLVDLAGNDGPRLFKEDSWSSEGTLIRYLYVEELQKVAQVFKTAIEANRPLPKRFASLPISRSQILKTLLSLEIFWAHRPPSRGSDRISAYEVMRGAVGFEPAMHLVEISEKARSDEPTADPRIDLLNRLWRLEEQVDRHKIEDWIQVDGSEGGVGVTIPALLPRHVAGSLVAIRYAEEPGWHLGLVRRIGNSTGTDPKLGLQTFPGSPLAIDVFAVPSAHEGNKSIVSFKAITFDADDKQLLIPTGMYAENRILEFKIGAIAYQVKLAHLLESGPDYELVEYVFIAD